MIRVIRVKKGQRVVIIHPVNYPQVYTAEKAHKVANVDGDTLLDVYVFSGQRALNRWAKSYTGLHWMAIRMITNT